MGAVRDVPVERDVLGDRDACFQVGDVTLTTRLIEGEFPNYQGLIPTSQPNAASCWRPPGTATSRPRRCSMPRN